MDHSQLAKAVFDVAHLTGTFQLRSGQVSNEYFDKYRFESRPDLLQEIARQMAPLVPSDTDALAGLEMGGIPIATALSLETGLPVAFIRKTAKDYGTCRFAEGLDVAGKKLCLIEDVVTTGGQLLLSTADLRMEEATVENALCVIYRGKSPPDKMEQAGLKLQNLFTMEQLKEAGQT